MADRGSEAFAVLLSLLLFLELKPLKLGSNIFGNIVDVDGNCSLSEVVLHLYFDREEKVFRHTRLLG